MKAERYTVLRDTSEKAGYGWTFEESASCAGTVERNLYTADYSLEGHYDNKDFVIERKNSVQELVSCVSQVAKWDDFRQELERLEEFKHPFVICEFPFSLLKSYPYGSGIPRHIWRKIKVRPQFILKRMEEIFVHFKTPFLFVDTPLLARELAQGLFKRIVENAPPVPQ